MCIRPGHDYTAGAVAYTSTGHDLYHSVQRMLCMAFAFRMIRVLGGVLCTSWAHSVLHAALKARIRWHEQVWETLFGNAVLFIFWYQSVLSGILLGSVVVPLRFWVFSFFAADMRSRFCVC